MQPAPLFEYYGIPLSVVVVEPSKPFVDRTPEYKAKYHRKTNKRT